MGEEGGGEVCGLEVSPGEYLCGLLFLPFTLSLLLGVVADVVWIYVERFDGWDSP